MVPTTVMASMTAAMAAEDAAQIDVEAHSAGPATRRVVIIPAPRVVARLRIVAGRVGPVPVPVAVVAVHIVVAVVVVGLAAMALAVMAAVMLRERSRGEHEGRERSAHDDQASN